nr:helix-turn-helix domain-containing protein [Hoeflea prorocentri]
MRASQSVELPVFSTKGQRDPFGYWHDSICSNYTSLSPQRLGEGAFSGSIVTTQIVGESTMSVIRSGSQIVRRTARDISASPSDSVFVNFQLDGSSTISQRGMNTKVPKGSAVVLDARRPFSMKFDGAFRQACLHLPASEIANQGECCAEILGRAIPIASPTATALLHDMRMMLAGRASRDTVTGMVSLLLAQIAGTKNERIADQHLDVVRTFVQSNAANPDLSPQKVAKHFRISVRHVHKLFARTDQSFGQYLLTVRLNAAKDLVVRSSLPISQIAGAVGFRNDSHFSRSFHSRYGITARRLRHISGRKMH